MSGSREPDGCLLTLYPALTVCSAWTCSTVFNHGGTKPGTYAGVSGGWRAVCALTPDVWRCEKMSPPDSSYRQSAILWPAAKCILTDALTETSPENRRALGFSQTEGSHIFSWDSLGSVLFLSALAPSSDQNQQAAEVQGYTSTDLVSRFAAHFYTGQQHPTWQICFWKLIQKSEKKCSQRPPTNGSLSFKGQNWAPHPVLNQSLAGRQDLLIRPSSGTRGGVGSP